MSEDYLIEYNENEDYYHYDSGYYWEKWDACSIVFVSKKVVAKYKLEREPIEEWIKYARGFSDYQDKDDDFFSDIRSHYAQILYLDHIAVYSKTKDADRTTDTPHGHVKSLEFVAWFNSIPFQLFKEHNEGVFIERWCE